MKDCARLEGRSRDPFSLEADMHPTELLRLGTRDMLMMGK